MKVIYIGTKENTDINNLLSGRFGDDFSVLFADSKPELSAHLAEFTSDELVLCVGGLFLGPVNTLACVTEYLDCPSTVVKTKNKSQFTGKKRVEIPDGAEILRDYDKNLFGIFTQKDKYPALLMVAETDSEAIYTHIDELTDWFENHDRLMEPPADDEMQDEMNAWLDEVEIEKPAEDEEKRSPKKKRLVKFLAVVLSLLLIISAAGITSFKVYFEPVFYDQAVTEYKRMYGRNDLTVGLPANYREEYGMLYGVNKNVYGWLTVPSTSVNLPVVMDKTESWRHKLLDGSYNKYGIPRFSKEYKPGDFNYNTVIYGNNYGDSRAFSDLTNYTSLDFYKTAAVLCMNTAELDQYWKVFGVVLTDSDDDDSFQSDKTYFFDSAAFDEYIAGIKSRSVIETGLDVGTEDELLTLVTDFRDGAGNRMSLSIVSRKQRPGEKTGVDVTKATENTDVILPTEFVEPTTAPETLSSHSIVSTDASGRPVKTAAVPVGAKPITSAKNTTGSTSVTTGAKPATTKPTARPTSPPTPTVKPPVTQPPITQPPGELKKIRAKNQSTGEVLYDTPQNIVARILEAEMGSHYELEALKAQAVATYSYLLYGGAETGSAPQAPMKSPGSRSIQAANAVAGQVLYYNGSIANTTYYAISAGKTANCREVWSADLPYLRSVDSSVDKNVSGFQTVRTYKASDVKYWVKSQYGVDLSSVSKSSWFRCSYDSNQLYTVSVNLGGQKSVKGTSLRNELFTASRVGSGNVLRSHAYTVSYRASDDCFVFTVKGYGHGVGMSQTGANQYAKNGWKYNQILLHYYQGTAIKVR